MDPLPLALLLSGLSCQRPYLAPVVVTDRLTDSENKCSLERFGGRNTDFPGQSMNMWETEQRMELRWGNKGLCLRYWGADSGDA